MFDESSTQALYIFIVFCATVFSAFSYKRSSDKNYMLQSDTVSYRLFPYILSFLIVSFFATFTEVGTDRAGYIYYFGKTHLGDGNPWALEIGYRVLMDIITLVFLDKDLFLKTIATIYVPKAKKHA